jgi:hypothetical protein
MNLQLVSAASCIADVVKAFNPQSPQARAIFDFVIVVIVVILRSSLASRGRLRDCPTASC